MANKRRFETAAIAVAQAGSGVGGRNRHSYRIGAVLVKGNAIVGSGFNSYKEDKRLRKWTRYLYLHAELAAISSRGFGGCRGITLYVARIRSNGTLGMSKPCAVCQAVIDEVGIKRVYYSNHDGRFIELQKG